MAKPPYFRRNIWIDDFTDYLKRAYTDDDYEAIRRSEIVGRPIGSEDFLKSLETQLSRPSAAKKEGAKRSNSVYKRHSRWSLSP